MNQRTSHARTHRALTSAPVHRIGRHRVGSAGVRHQVDGEPAGKRRGPRPRPARRVLIAVGELLITAAVLMVAYLGWQLWIQNPMMASSQSDEAAVLLRSWAKAPAPATASSSTPQPGSAFAAIEIPRFGPQWQRPIIEGTALPDLDRGVGHYAGTAMPGEVGNFAVAGHRLTHGSAFMHIDALMRGDVIGIRTPTMWFLYQVTGSEIVSPNRVQVLAPVPEHPGSPPTTAMLTLTSCNPLYGHSQRYIVYAILIAHQPAANGTPRSLSRAVA